VGDIPALIVRERLLTVVAVQLSGFTTQSLAGDLAPHPRPGRLGVSPGPALAQRRLLHHLCALPGGPGLFRLAGHSSHRDSETFGTADH
jgi:hypothetical protein